MADISKNFYNFSVLLKFCALEDLVTKVLLNLDQFHSILATYFKFWKSPIMDQFVTFRERVYNTTKNVLASLANKLSNYWPKWLEIWSGSKSYCFRSWLSEIQKSDWLLVAFIWRHRKRDYANDDQFAPNFDMPCNTMQCVSVPNLKLFGPMEIELRVKEVGEFSVRLYRKISW